MADTEIDFTAPASLRKWPSINKERVPKAWGGVPYLVIEGTLDECMRRRKFSREFKIEAVKLVRERGVSVAQAGRDLDVHENVLRKWIKEFGSDPAQAFPRKLRQAAFRASVLFTAFLRLVAIFVHFIFEVRCGQTETLGPPRP